MTERAIPPENIDGWDRNKKPAREEISEPASYFPPPDRRAGAGTRARPPPPLRRPPPPPPFRFIHNQMMNKMRIRIIAVVAFNSSSNTINCPFEIGASTNVRARRLRRSALSTAEIYGVWRKGRIWLNGFSKACMSC